MEGNFKTRLDWHHDELSADASQIQGAYEAAVGAFLVTFNGIENTINEIIYFAMHKCERPDILKRLQSDSFSRKLITLELISLVFPRVAQRSLTDKLRYIASQRNDLAHGHFKQNPFDGTYEIVTRSKSRSQSTAEIVRLTKRAKQCWQDLRYFEAYFEFEDLAEDGSHQDDAPTE